MALNLSQAETDELKQHLGAGAFAKDLSRIFLIKRLFPDNLCTKHFDFEYFNSLDDAGKAGLLEVARSGIENPDSGLGAYAMNPKDYETFKPFLDKVIRDYHKVDASANHTTEWSLKGVAGIPEDGKLDLTKLGLGEISMRVRVGRNLSSFPLPGAMNKQNRIDLEAVMVKAFDSLIKHADYGGEYCSLTPGHANFIDEARYNELVAAHIMFKNMDKDPYLTTAGIASDWPFGRGCYISADKGFIVWVGEEDHLRIMCMKKGSLLNEVFDRLSVALGVIEGLEGIDFAKSEGLGYVTSCPTNLGTGMRASVHVALPKLTKNGSDVSEAKAVAKKLGLSVRGAGGEHTAAGAGGIVDISPSARFCIRECDIITALYKGISELMALENAA